jgi:hypothetical protein
VPVHLRFLDHGAFAGDDLGDDGVLVLLLDAFHHAAPPAPSANPAARAAAIQPDLRLMTGPFE